jgi:hypothetical protein
MKVQHENEAQANPATDAFGVDLISDALPFGRLWYAEAPDAVGYAIDYAKFRSRSHDAVIRVYMQRANVRKSKYD